MFKITCNPLDTFKAGQANVDLVKASVPFSDSDRLPHCVCKGNKLSREGRVGIPRRHLPKTCAHLLS